MAIPEVGVATAENSARVWRGVSNRPQPVLVIPAFKPASCLPEIIVEILRSGLIQHVIVINDGSGSEFEIVFDQLRSLDRVSVLCHMVNLGKGAALRTGFNFAGCRFPDTVGVVTADADGQHLVHDIIAVARALFHDRTRSLVLGVRRMAGDVPLRSKFGNTVTRYIMRAITGQRLSDTQTGLRGIPRDLLPVLLKTKTTGYDFELDMLVTCKYTSRSITEIPITTVYLEGNRSSHFNPLLDSMRIYFVLLRFTFVSLMTAALDNIVFFCGMTLFANVLAAQVTGRLCAGTFNYLANKHGVFQSHAANVVALPKYWLSVAVFGGLSYILMQFLLNYVNLKLVPAKLVAESFMFLFSFVVQRDFVFSQKEVPAQ